MFYKSQILFCLYFVVKLFSCAELELFDEEPYVHSFWYNSPINSGEERNGTIFISAPVRLIDIQLGSLSPRSRNQGRERLIPRLVPKQVGGYPGVPVVCYYCNVFWGTSGHYPHSEDAAECIKLGDECTGTGKGPCCSGTCMGGTCEEKACVREGSNCKGQACCAAFYCTKDTSPVCACKENGIICEKSGSERYPCCKGSGCVKNKDGKTGYCRPLNCTAETKTICGSKKICVNGKCQNRCISKNYPCGTGSGDYRSCCSPYICSGIPGEFKTCKDECIKNDELCNKKGEPRHCCSPYRCINDYCRASCKNTNDCPTCTKKNPKKYCAKYDAVKFSIVKNYCHCKPDNFCQENGQCTPSTPCCRVRPYYHETNCGVRDGACEPDDMGLKCAANATGIHYEEACEYAG